MKVQRNYGIARHDISPLFLPFHTFLGEIMTLDEHFRCNKKRVCVPVRIGTRYLYIFGIVLIDIPLFHQHTVISSLYKHVRLRTNIEPRQPCIPRILNGYTYAVTFSYSTTPCGLHYSRYSIFTL